LGDLSNGKYGGQGRSWLDQGRHVWEKCQRATGSRESAFSECLGRLPLGCSKFIKQTKTKTEALFFAVLNRYASDGKVQSINVRSVGRMLRLMTKARGLQPMHPQLLRHACATHMLDNGCPLDVIAEVLGHDDLDVTAHYAQVSTRLMMKADN
jgi:integrase